MAAWMKVFMSMWAVTSQWSGVVNGRRECRVQYQSQPDACTMLTPAREAPAGTSSPSRGRSPT